MNYLESWWAGDRFSVGRWVDEAAQWPKGQTGRIVGLDEEPSEILTGIVGWKPDSDHPSRLHSGL